MLSRSSDQGAASAAPAVFGRTGWDVLASSRRWIVAAITAVMAVLVCYLFRDSIAVAWPPLAACLVLIGLYIPVVVLGLLFGRHVYYWHILRNGVIVVVEPIEGPASCYRISEDSFKMRLPEGTPMTPFATSTGEPFFIIKGFDQDGKIIPGDVHSESEDFLRVMAHRTLYNVWLKDYHDAVTRSVELETVPWREGQNFARAVIKDAVEAQNVVHGLVPCKMKEGDDGSA